MKKTCLLFIVVLIAAGINAQSLQLASVFSDHMVLQRNKILTFWGTAASHSEVKITFNENQKSARTAPDGHWEISFPAMKAGGPFVLTVENNNHKIVLSDILIGDVWVCSGQSNMEFLLRESASGTEDIPEADYPNIRLYNMQQIARTNNIAWSKDNLEKVNHFQYFSPTLWSACTPASARNFSAVAFYFGKMIHQQTNVPVGLILNAVGGSTTESWIDRTTLEHHPELNKLLHDWYNNDLVQSWCRERAAKNTELAGKNDQKHPYQPAYLYNAGISQLTKFPIQGAIWYQGESNAHNIKLHEILFPALVKSWRIAWGESFPFYYVQLSSMAVGRDTWGEFRDSQRRMMTQIPNSGMAVSSDVGDSTNVHPTQKKQVGERLARWALSETYGLNITKSGPLFKKVTFKKNKAFIFFTDGKGLKTSDGKGVRTVEIAGEDKVFFPARVKIKGNHLEAETEKVPQPIYVRYGWEPFSVGNLVNKDDLPASTVTSEK